MLNLLGSLPKEPSSPWSSSWNLFWNNPSNFTVRGCAQSSDGKSPKLRRRNINNFHLSNFFPLENKRSSHFCRTNFVIWKLSPSEYRHHPFLFGIKANLEQLLHQKRFDKGFDLMAISCQAFDSYWNKKGPCISECCGNSKDSLLFRSPTERRKKREFDQSPAKSATFQARAHPCTHLPASQPTFLHEDDEQPPEEIDASNSKDIHDILGSPAFVNGSKTANIKPFYDFGNNTWSYQLFSKSGILYPQPIRLEWASWSNMANICQSGRKEECLLGQFFYHKRISHFYAQHHLNLMFRLGAIQRTKVTDFKSLQDYSGICNQMATQIDVRFGYSRRDLSYQDKKNVEGRTVLARPKKGWVNLIRDRCQCSKGGDAQNISTERDRVERICWSISCFGAYTTDGVWKVLNESGI